MRVALTRSGGFAGTRAHVAVDSANLPAAEAKQLRALVAAADVVSTRSPAARDEFVYELVIEDDGRPRTCRLTDAAMSDRTRALIDWLFARAG